MSLIYKDDARFMGGDSCMKVEIGGRISKAHNVCGGDACIRDTRITVWGLAEWRRLGQSDEEILSGIPGLTRADLNAAWEYSRLHADEIETAIRLNTIA